MSFCLVSNVPTRARRAHSPQFCLASEREKKKNLCLLATLLPALLAVFGRSKNKTVSKESCQRSFNSELSGIARTSVGY